MPPQPDSTARLALSASGVAVGDLLAGKYRVERVIAAGGMGTVVQAQHVQLQQRVALKLMHAEARRDELLVHRFLREARAVAHLRTEHVARVLDVGTLENGCPFMVMELLTGSDLGTLLRERGPLSVADAIGYVVQACEAVAEAHAVGIVHRDLKPSNLFLTWRVNGEPLVKVLDFGISKWERPNTPAPRLTTTSAFIGSPLYMSPEQMREPHGVDHRADVWALGVVLHELLTGAPPFRSEHVSEVAAMVLRDPPPPLRRIRHDVPEEVEGIVLRCLAKDPGHRFEHVEALVRELVPFAGAGAGRAGRRSGDYTRTSSRPPSEAAGTRRSGRAPALEDTIAAPSDGAGRSPVAISDGFDPAPPPATASREDIAAYLMRTERDDGSRGRGFPMTALLGAVLVAVVAGFFVAVVYNHNSKQPQATDPSQTPPPATITIDRDKLLRRAGLAH